MVSENVDGVITQHIVDPSQKLFQTIQDRSSGAITQSYIFGIDKLETNVTSSTAQYYLFDRLGSLRIVTGPSSNLITSNSFDAFGNRVGP
jgi:hypothetical protein